MTIYIHLNLCLTLYNYLYYFLTNNKTMFSNNSVSISLPAHLNSPRTKFKVKFNS